MMHNFKGYWVRKLTGKPAFLTIADCESETRRIHVYQVAFSAADNNALRIQADLVCPARAIAWPNCRASSCASRTATRTCLDLVFGTFGLPLFLAINYLMFYKNSSCN